MKEIDSISYKTVLEVQKFFISSSESTIESDLNKVLKLKQ